MEPIEMERFTELLQQYHLREGVQLLEARAVEDGEVFTRTRLEDGEEVSYTMSAQDVNTIMRIHP